MSNLAFDLLSEIHSRVIKHDHIQTFKSMNQVISWVFIYLAPIDLVFRVLFLNIENPDSKALAPLSQLLPLLLDHFLNYHPNKRHQQQDASQASHNDP